jgi:L,D-transpeptidase catalytic domain
VSRRSSCCYCDGDRAPYLQPRPLEKPPFLAIAFTAESLKLTNVIRKIALSVFVICALGLAVYFYAHHNWHPLPHGTTVDRIVVEKAARKLSIFRDGRRLKTYRVALGQSPIGPKEREGDMKTPEGIYQIDGRNPQSSFHLALHISYPSNADNARAAERGVSAGFDIMIHGIRNGRGWIGAFHRRDDWTAGCIALTDEEIEELWRVTPDGTTIEIRP